MRTAGTGDVADGGRLPWALIAVTGTEDEPLQDEVDHPLCQQMTRMIPPTIGTGDDDNPLQQTRVSRRRSPYPQMTLPTTEIGSDDDSPEW